MNEFYRGKVEFRYLEEAIREMNLIKEGLRMIFLKDMIWDIDKIDQGLVSYEN